MYHSAQDWHVIVKRNESMMQELDISMKGNAIAPRNIKTVSVLFIRDDF